MANLLKLVKMTVSELRELARKYLGRGHTRLKTRSELIAALKQKLGDFGAKATTTKTKSPPKPKPTQKKKTARPSKRAPPARAARVSPPPPPAADIGTPRTPQQAAPVMRPVNEGFFVGAQAPAVIPPTPIHSAPALPESYGSNQVVAINRGPGTLFVFWDFAEDRINAVTQGLVDLQLVLRVYVGTQIVRHLPVELAHGRAYLEDLPDDVSRVELHAVGSNRSRAIAGSDVPASFRGLNPSLLRLADLAWDTPLSGLPQAKETGVVRVREQTNELAQTVRARLGGVAGSSSPLAPWGEAGAREAGAQVPGPAASPLGPWGAARRRFRLPSSR